MKTTELPSLSQMYSLNTKTWKNFKSIFFIFTKSLYYCLMLFHTNLQQVILHIVINYLLAGCFYLLPRHISISEIQFDISKTFSDTLNKHPCHPYIYLTLQKKKQKTYQVLLTAVWKYKCYTIPFHQNKISVNYTILPSHKKVVNNQFFMDTSTHTHTLSFH